MVFTAFVFVQSFSTFGFIPKRLSLVTVFIVIRMEHISLINDSVTVACRIHIFESRYLNTGPLTSPA